MLYYYLSSYSVGISYEERARQEAQLQAQANADAALLETRHHEMRQLEVSFGVIFCFTFHLLLIARHCRHQRYIS